MSERIGLYGGSFDPIHFGHLIPARSIAERLALSRVVLIPSARPPHKHSGTVADVRDRLAMATLAVQGDPLFQVSDVELHREGPSYTFDTVQQFRAMLHPAAELFWIIGADSLPELPTWYRISELVAAVTIVTVARPGWEGGELPALTVAVGPQLAEELLENCYETPEIDISSTDIWQRVGEARSIRYLTPDAVVSYIESHQLYRRSR